MTNFREFFWPLLEPEKKGGNKIDEELEIHITDENLERAFELKSKIYDSEEDRRKSVETKSSLFLSTISVATSIVVASNALITSSEQNNLIVIVSVFISFILTLYTVRTVWFSIKALERGSYSVVGIEDINIKGDKNTYYRNLIICLSKKTKANQDTINHKVDYMTMAQEYYKRAVVVICIYAFLILLFCLFVKKSKQIESVKPKFVYSFSNAFQEI